MSRTRGLLLLGAVVLMALQTTGPAQAERRSDGWRQDHYGSRYNYRLERIRSLPRHPHAPRYRPRDIR